MLPAVRVPTAGVWMMAASLAGCGGPETAKAPGEARARATSPPLVADVACASGAKCRVANGPVRLQMRPYIDVNFPIIAANDELLGATLIMTAYFDQLSNLDPLLKFTLLRRARVYVAGMFATPHPAWLEGGWRREFSNKWPHGLQLMVDPKVPDVAELTVYSRDMDPGPVAFGPIQIDPERPDRTVMMYLVVVSENAAPR